MKVWWRPELLDEHEEELVRGVLKAHALSTLRDNPSTLAVALAAESSGNYMHAIVAALSMFGGRHGPLVETYDLLASNYPRERACKVMDAGHRVPGWGNGFHKKGIEPNWLPVWEKLQRWPALTEKIAEVDRVLEIRERDIYPNPSCLTAATAIITRCPRESVGWFLVAGRLDAWSYVFQRSQRQL